MPTLETLLAQVEQFVASEKSYVEAPHIIDVMLPMMCSYLPFWWAQGPDNQDPVGGCAILKLKVKIRNINISLLL